MILVSVKRSVIVEYDASPKIPVHILVSLSCVLCLPQMLFISISILEPPSMLLHNPQQEYRL